MKQDPGKFIRLFGLLFLSALSFLVVITLIFLGLRLVFGLVNQIPWIIYIYTLIILSLPVAIFLLAYFVFLSRTHTHPSLIVRTISYLIFIGFIGTWIVFYILDIISFYHSSELQITHYRCWGTIFIAASVAGLFLTGVLQALTAEKEEDWLERARQKDPL